jgi:hypothetical protein
LVKQHGSQRLFKLLIGHVQTNKKSTLTPLLKFIPNFTGMMDGNSSTEKTDKMRGCYKQ